MKTYVSLLLAIFTSILIATNAFSRDTCDQIPKKNGLCQLTLDAEKADKPIIGKEYIFECCDDDFTLTQFVEPNLLLFTWIPEGMHCWQSQRVLTGRRLFLQMNEVAFQEVRRERGLINQLTLSDMGIFEWGETRVKVIDVNENTMSDGTVMNIAIIILK